MLNVKFTDPIGKDQQILAPLSSFRLIGDAFHLQENEHPFATHRGGAWHIGDRMFIFVEITGLCQLHFKNSDQTVSTVYGPFDRIKFADGVIRAEKQPDEMVALFNETTRLWHAYQNKIDWHIVIFQAVEPE